MDVCVQCGAAGSSKCGRCKRVSYCSKGCQAAHWKAGHKGQCGAVVRSGETARLPSPKAKTTSTVPQKELVFDYVFASQDDAGKRAGPCQLVATGADLLFPRARTRQLIDYSELDAAPSVGMKNVGNSCYLNSVVQCLANTRALRNFFAHDPQHNSPSPDGGPAGCARGRRGEVCARCLLSSLFETFAKARGRGGEGMVMVPRDLITVLPRLGDFVPGRQEDAHDFLYSLLMRLDACTVEDGLRSKHDDLSSAAKAPLCTPAIEQSSVIRQLFSGILQSRIRCGVCGCSSTTFDTSMDLQLELASTKSVSIEEALESYTKVEHIEEAVGWRCGPCGRAVDATKQITIFSPPPLLVVTLKRFDYLNNGFKINKRVVFREDIHLSHVLARSSPAAGRGAHYRLRALIVHYGASIHVGHFVAFVRDARDGQWYLCDDEHVVAVSSSTVLKQSGYIFLYDRVDKNADDDAPTADVVRKASHTPVSATDFPPPSPSTSANFPPPPSSPLRAPQFSVFHCEEEDGETGDVAGLGQFHVRVNLPLLPSTVPPEGMTVTVLDTGEITAHVREPAHYASLTVPLPFALQPSSCTALYFPSARALLISVRALCAGPDSDGEERGEGVDVAVRAAAAGETVEAVMAARGATQGTEMDVSPEKEEGREPAASPPPSPTARGSGRKEGGADMDGTMSYQAMWRDIETTHMRGVRTISSAPAEERGTHGSAASTPAPVKKVGRNKPCPCGSGKKYKNCHGK